MTNLGRWSSQTVTTVLSTELNSLADQANAISSAAYDNSTNRDMYCDIVVSFTGVGNWGTNFAAGQVTGETNVYIFCLESVDGTNFASVGSGDYVRAIPLILVNMPMYGSNGTTLRATARNVLIPPTQFKIGLQNNMGTNFGASGNLVKIITYGWNTRA